MGNKEGWTHRSRQSVQSFGSHQGHPRAALRTGPGLPWPRQWLVLERRAWTPRGCTSAVRRAGHGEAAASWRGAHVFRGVACPTPWGTSPADACSAGDTPPGLPRMAPSLTEPRPALPGKLTAMDVTHPEGNGDLVSSELKATPDIDFPALPEAPLRAPPGADARNGCPVATGSCASRPEPARSTSCQRMSDTG